MDKRFWFRLSDAMRMRLIPCVTVVTLLAVACGGDAGEAGPSARSTPTSERDEEFFLADGTVVLEADDPNFEGPTALPPGPTSFTLKNEGTITHQALMVRLADDDLPLYEIADLPSDSIFERLTKLGAIERVKAGETSSERIEVELEPGRYGFLCLLIDTNGYTHASLGMSMEITVAG